MAQSHRQCSQQPQEKVFHTVKISTEEDLRKMIPVMERETEVALNLYGVYIGRFGEVGWVTLFLGNALVPIDALTLGKEMSDFWKFLGRHLFENERIKKVVHNSRPIADYLYHNHCICIRNVFDIQVAQFYNWTRGQERNTLIASRNQLQYMKLSDCLRKYLTGSDAVIAEELVLLMEFENRDFSARSPLMERPVREAKACKGVAISMKYLLSLKKVFENMILQRVREGTAQQMTEMLMGNKEQAEAYLRDPLLIPDAVYDSAVQPGSASAPSAQDVPKTN